MLRTVASSSLAPSVKAKLIRAGFCSVADLQELRPGQLSKEVGVSQEEAAEILKTLHTDALPVNDGGLVARGVTALELLQREQAQGSIVTFCSALDSALGGGVPVGKTMEVCGPPGVGKTQLCIQLAVDVQIPMCFGGLKGQSLYIDTEGSFMVERVVDVARAAVEHCSLLAEDAEQQKAMKEFTVEKILSCLFLMRCHDYVKLLAQSYLLPSFLSEHPEVRLIVIDSIAYPFRRDFEDFSHRTRLLNALAQHLNQLATQHNVAIVLTNQMTTKVWNGQSKMVPALGESWGHAAAQRLILYWEGARRLAVLSKSSSQMEATVPYQITEQGFRDNCPSDQKRHMPASPVSNEFKRPRVQETLS
ncbi:DNA repair protein RAD51 homolog 3 [Denticeps clupeoides]|uniref:DNA repair protein RAD51 homolog 3 n=1 Tax=Denticeps clupeoides TaxID=299321 RepID=A0AAY4EK02_9TELE|nr:DNA repair protein RAD51 homolog 3 [Denticeps clupeoides]